MNIQMQMGGIFILLLVLYFYKRQKNLGLYAGKLFLSALYITIICLVLDVVSIVLIVHQDSFPLWLVKTECKLYLVSLIANGYAAFAYANADIRSPGKMDRVTRWLTAVAAVVALLVLALPIETYYDGLNVAYTYGPACYAAYVGALILILTTVFKLVTQGKQMNPKRRRVMILWVGIWILAAVTQFLNRKLLLVGFASVMSILILFYELENPEIYLDRATGFYNKYALVEMIRQRYRLGQDCYGLMVSLENFHGKNITPDRIERAMEEVADFMRGLSETTVYKTDDREYSLAFQTPDDLEQAKAIVYDRFRKGWLEDEGESVPIFLQPNYLIIPSCQAAKSADELLSLLRYFRMNGGDAAQNYTLVLNEDTVAREREGLIAEITQAIKEDRIEVFYQPIYSTAKKRFISAEALARIRRTDGSLVPPGLFVPLAEETGLIVKIGKLMFEKTCRFIKENDLSSYGVEYVDVNLSGVQCESKDLARSYISIMERYDLPPQYINLEITESAAITRKDVMLENMHALIDYGVTFSLDDFGSGQSNLNCIVDMPVHIVKFDYDMTQAYFDTPKARFVVQAAMNMIHDMKLKIVSEGVETAKQLAMFETLGIDYIQGYYFSEPIAADAFLDFLRERNQVGIAGES